MKKLKNYNIDPDLETQRKMDYYFTPYTNEMQTSKYMNFDNDLDN